MRNQFESLESRRLLNAGDLDPTFGAGGAVGYRAATDESIGIVRELPDGKLLIGASRGGLLELLRLNADGSLDSSFGSAGKIATHYPSEGTVTVSPTGKLLATIGANNDIGLFHADGSLIKTITDSKWQGELSMGFTPDDELLAAAATSDQHVLVERFTSSGQLDTSFASAGKATINEHELQELRVNPTGTALVVASTTSSFYDPDIGEVEYSYTTNVYAIDTAGQVNEPVGFAAGSESPAPPVGPLRRRADGDWAVAYESNWDLNNYWHLTRIGFDGSAKLVDTLLSTSPANVYNVVDIGAEPTDREVVISNYSQDDPRTPWFITRYFADGTVDPSYGKGGQIALDILPNVRGAATVDHNGNVIIAATQMSGDQNKLVFVRVQGGVGHPTSFNLNADGTLNITATPGPDIIDIGLRHLRHGQDVRMVVRQGDEAHSFDAAKVKRLNILAGDGNDNINNTTDLPCYIDGGHGNNILNGGQGNDTLIGGKNDDLLFGNGGNDQLFGNNGNDKLLGGAGNDYLLGGAGNDRLFGEDGRDTLSGAGGNDRLFGGSSADRLTGGMGSDSSENDPLDNRAGDIETLLA